MTRKPPDCCPSPSSEFDPPHPPNETALGTAAVMTAGVAGFGGAVALEVCTGGILTLLEAFAMLPADEEDPIDLAALKASVRGLSDTSAPHFTDDQKTTCTRCAKAVEFAAMSLSEHGYFCATCAEQLR